DADDHADAPASVAALEGLPHQLHITHALEGVVSAPLGQLDEVRHEIAGDFPRVDELRHAEAAGQSLPRRVDVDADDLVGASEPRSLHDVEPDAAQAEHHDVAAGFDLGRVDHGANPR